jgi:hypothetical protein
MLGWPVGLPPESPCADVYRALRQAGADPFRATLLTAIAWAESRCNPEATAECPPRCVPGQLPEYSVGVFQINLKAHPDISEECARDLLCSARYALRLPLTAWSTFKSGEYLKAPFLREFGITVPKITPSVSVQLAPDVRKQVVLLVALVLIVVAGAELLRR